MRKLLDIVVTLGVLACAVVFWMTGGSGFLQMRSGAETAGESFAEAEGKYIAYEAAFPVASCVEEYYSGDPDRVRSSGYVIYDQERQSFLYVVVSDRDSARLENLMWNLQLAGELRADKDMSPFTVQGTLEPMGESEVERVLPALEESKVLGLYWDYYGEEAYREAYFSDEYGKVIETVCKGLEQDGVQTEWYCIKDGVINGLETGDILISVLAAALSLLIFVIRVIMLFTGGRKNTAGESSVSGGRIGEFYAAQREWVEEWCEYSLKRGRMFGYLSVAVSVAIFAGIGIYLKMPVERLVAFYLALGLLLGEAVGILFWLGQKGQSKPDKILKKIAKNIDRALPSREAREEFAEDILKAGKEWTFREKRKDSMQQGVVGSRYWVSMGWNGLVTIVDSQRLDRIETATISGQIRSGKVRIRYVSYVVRFFEKSAAPKKNCDKVISFQSKDAEGLFMVLVRKRVGDRIEIRAES